MTEETSTTSSTALTPADVLALLDQQRAMESQGVEWGRDNFRGRVAKAKEYGEATVAGAARKVLQDDMEKLIAVLEAHLAKYEGKRGVKPLDVKMLKMVGVDRVAYITAKCILDHLAERIVKSKLLIGIAERVVGQARIDRFQAQAPALFEYVVKGFKTTNYSHMSKVMAHAMGSAKDLETGLPLVVKTDDLDDITDQQLTTLGTQLLDHFITATAAVTVESIDHIKAVRGKNVIRTEQVVVPTLKTLEWIDARNASAETLCPVNLPMVVPPLPWGPGKRGGYRFDLFGKYAFARCITRQQRDRIEALDIPIVYRAVNALQDTAWRVNESVAALIAEIAARGGDLAGIPKLAKIALPEKPADIATNDTARQTYRKQAKRVHEANLSRRLQAADYLRTMQVVAKVKDAKAFYFPYNTDFRGRVYPVCTYLNPQGDDLSKALLTFAEGKALGADGARWLALHGASALDKLPDGRKVSTLTLDERVQWINDNSADLVAFAKDPMGNRWWLDKDAKGKSNVGDPLSFFAFCVEWAGYVEQGESYVCSLPVCVDGTNNGLQHFAAMFRDEIGGRAVNLIPTHAPHDVYRIIADAVLENLEERAVEDDIAALWLRSGLVDRTLCKRPTMTFGYGSKAYGFSHQLREELKGRENWKTEVRAKFDRVYSEDGVTKTKEGGLLNHATDYLARVIYETLKGRVQKAVEGMDWMRQSARIIAREQKEVEWTVPMTGFSVRQHYRVYRKQQIRTALCGGISRAVVRTETDQIAVTKQSNAVAPNIVHSLDAAALHMTVGAAVDAGLDSFLFIHDSFGTHAADMGTLAVVLREQFVKLYSHDVVADLAAQFAAQSPADAELPVVPTRGSLDLQGIHKSLYFFS
jgi:DNA-directed RNA polymerase